MTRQTRTTAIRSPEPGPPSTGTASSPLAKRAARPATIGVRLLSRFRSPESLPSFPCPSWFPIIPWAGGWLSPELVSRLDELLACVGANHNPSVGAGDGRFLHDGGSDRHGSGGDPDHGEGVLTRNKMAEPQGPGRVGGTAAAANGRTGSGYQGVLGRTTSAVAPHSDATATIMTPHVEGCDSAIPHTPTSLP